MDFGCLKARCVRDFEMIVLEWLPLTLQGAEKGLETREVDKYVFSSGEIVLIVDLSCPMMGCTN